MHDKDLYKKFLGIDKPWFISQVTMDDAALTIQVFVEFRGEPCCPRCRKACAGYDKFVALHQRSVGAPSMERVDQLGDELQTCANDPRGGDGAKTFGGNHQRDRVESNKCAR